MGKRIAPEPHTPAANGIRKRKRVCNDHQEITNYQSLDQNGDSKSGNRYPALNTSCDDNNSPKPIYHLRPSVVNGIILEDIAEKKWRIGKPIGKGNFGEIFLASDNVYVPVTSENAKYVVKIEPHSNGPLFVEIHCLLNTAKQDGVNLPPGMPEYIASGSHYFGNARYRFLVLKRFDRDLHSIIKNRRVSQKCVLTLALQIIDVLQHLHDKGYCHNDIKAQNLMISACTFSRSQLKHNQSGNDKLDVDNDDEKGSGNENSDSDSGNSSNEDDDEEEEEEEEDDDDDQDGDHDVYRTPSNKKQQRPKSIVQYSGSNPVRSCRREKRTSMYDEMVKSHYLRPAKRISYSEFFNEDNSKDEEDRISNYNSSQYLDRKCRSASARKPTSRTHQKMKQMSESSDGSDSEDDTITEERVFLIDFGLASKFMDKGVHRPFVMDQRRAHDGTLEFTSRDAHMGAHSRRSDLECLGYNLLFWSQGHLPWKDAAAQHQNERVHWVKEYLMKDVKEMLKHIYGNQVPKYLGEYLQYVGQLAYHERPDYAKCRRIFEREYVSLGYDLEKMELSTDELIKTSHKVKEEIENNNVLEMKNIKSIMKNLSVIMPFHESTLSNRVSPKNLRSKSAKKKSVRKKFSWTEILSQDPDQIARERAEKEFDREPITETPLIRYTGNPTYAILEIQNRLKLKDRIDAYETDEESSDEEADTINSKSYSIKKRQPLPSINEVATQINANSNYSNNKPGTGAPSRSTRTKAGLKTFVTIPTTENINTKRGLDHSTQLTSTVTEKRQRRTRRCLIKTGSTGDFTTSDESSCSSINSNSINSTTINLKKRKASANVASVGRRRKVNRSDRSSSTDHSSNDYSNIDYSNEEDDTSNCSDNVLLFSPKRTRNATEKLKMKLVNTKGVLVSSEDIVGAKRRKRSIPKKRKSSTKDDCSEGEMVGERDLQTFKKRACRG